MRYTLALVLLLTFAPACFRLRTNVSTPGDRCREESALRQSERFVSGNRNATADALEAMRCDRLDEVDQMERIRAVEAARREEDELAEANRRLDQTLAAIRRNPAVPDLGATAAEVRLMCTRQRGEVVGNVETIGCRLTSTTERRGASRSSSCEG